MASQNQRKKCKYLKNGQPINIYEYKINLCENSVARSYGFEGKKQQHFKVFGDFFPTSLSFLNPSSSSSQGG